MKKSDVEINYSALEEVQKHEFKKAHELFKLNCKKNPSYKTFNNLGIFYAEFGDTFQDNIDTRKEAKKYLFKANELQPNYFSLSELGDLYLKLNDYEKAKKIYIKALELKKSYAIINNLAVAEFHLKEYAKAAKYFKQAVEIAAKDKTEILESYAFALVKNKKYDLANRIFEKIISATEYEITPNTLLLAYLCENYKFVLNHYEEVLRSYILDVDTIRIIKYVLLKLNLTDRFERFCLFSLNKIEEEIVDSFDKKEIEKMLVSKKIDENEFEIVYEPYVVYECHIFGCFIHNNIF